MKKKIKKYEIDTFEKFLNVINEDNFDRFIYDFAEFVGCYLQLCKTAKGDSKDVKLNSELVKFKSFCWIDDGKMGIKYINMINNKTGEVNRLRKSKK